MIKNDNVSFTYDQLLKQKNNLDNMITFESAFYIETIYKDIDKPFFNLGNLNFLTN